MFEYQKIRLLMLAVTLVFPQLLFADDASCVESSNLYKGFREYRNSLLAGKLSSSSYASYFTNESILESVNSFREKSDLVEIYNVIDSAYYMVRAGEFIKVVLDQKVTSLSDIRANLDMLVLTESGLKRVKSTDDLEIKKVTVEYLCEDGAWNILVFEIDGASYSMADFEDLGIIDAYLSQSEYRGEIWVPIVKRVFQNWGIRWDNSGRVIGDNPGL